MADKQALTEVMKDILAERTQRAVAHEADVNQTTIHNMLRGQKPGYNLLLKIANNLKLEGDVRRRLFDACGYADPQASAGSEGFLEELTLRSFQGAKELPKEDIKTLNEEFRRRIAETRRARGLE